jgi:bifunctional DNase/RNase
MIQMKVQGLTLDTSTNSPIVILSEQEGKRSVPIWIGLLEATAIASELENISFSRPMTHDLFINTLRAAGWSILRVEIADIRDNTFFAYLHLHDQERRLIKIDSRPSDAIALSLRAGAPIFMARHILDAKLTPSQPEPDSQEKWREILESMAPEDFGKYKM